MTDNDLTPDEYPEGIGNGWCDECDGLIVHYHPADTPHGFDRGCVNDVRHDCYGDGHNNGGDPR